MTKPLEPSAALLEKLAGILHTALHELHGLETATDRLCRDPEVVDWLQRMMAIGLCPEPSPAPHDDFELALIPTGGGR